jgi:tetratricopeptide (TPR) repeat protein
MRHIGPMRLSRFAFLLTAVAALSLAAWPGRVAADQTDPRLPALFEQLKAAASDDEATVARAQIWKIWTAHTDPEINTLMLRGLHAMAEDEEDQAVAAFGEIIKREPDFAEGWNKRATAYFLMGDFDASVADIERTLQLEPHHFGALSGLGQIYLELGRKEAALKAFEAALAIDPHLAGVRAAVASLKKQLQGNPT